MKPRPDLEALHVSMKPLCISGNAETGELVRAVFKVFSASSHSFDQTTGVSLFRLIKGAHIYCSQK